MSARASELMADLLGSGATAPPPANPANSANREHSCGLAADLRAANGLRIAANLQADDPHDSQTFAAIRSGQNSPQTQQICGSSQASQVSQGASLGAVNPLVQRLLRWGWTEDDAKALAERIAERDHADDRRLCVQCHHYQPGRCRNPRAAGLTTAAIGRQWAELHQRCGGFLESHAAAMTDEPTPRSTP